MGSYSSQAEAIPLPLPVCCDPGVCTLVKTAKLIGNLDPEGSALSVLGP